MGKFEWVDLVDRDNQVIGQASRQEVRRKNLLHRGIAVLVRNSRAEVYVHQRTASKDLFPAMYDMFVGGVVGAGEDYLTAARREAAEELGVGNQDLEFLFDHLYEGPKNFSWVRCFQVNWDGPIEHQVEEIQWGDWLPEDELEKWSQEVPVVPDGLEVFQAYLRWKGAHG